MTRVEREEMWSERIAAQAASGLSGRMWCDREEVSYWSFMQWRRRLGGETFGERPLRFVRVLPVEADASAVRIRIAGALIEVGAGFDPGVLRRVVEALR
jgi:hypothetical protein